MEGTSPRNSSSSFSSQDLQFIPRSASSSDTEEEKIVDEGAEKVSSFVRQGPFLFRGTECEEIQKKTDSEGNPTKGKHSMGQRVLRGLGAAGTGLATIVSGAAFPIMGPDLFKASWSKTKDLAEESWSGKKLSDYEIVPTGTAPSRPYDAGNRDNLREYVRKEENYKNLRETAHRDLYLITDVNAGEVIFIPGGDIDKGDIRVLAFSRGNDGNPIRTPEDLHVAVQQFSVLYGDGKDLKGFVAFHINIGSKMFRGVTVKEDPKDKEHYLRINWGNPFRGTLISRDSKQWKEVSDFADKSKTEHKQKAAGDQPFEHIPKRKDESESKAAEKEARIKELEDLAEEKEAHIKELEDFKYELTDPDYAKFEDEG